MVYPRQTRPAAMYLIATGHSLNAVSRRLGISRAALRSWRDGGVEARTDRACFICADGLEAPAAAYAELFGYYLGDGCISSTRSSFSLRVACDAKYPGIIDAVTSSSQLVHPGAGVFHVPAPGAVVVHSNWKHWPCLFPQHGPGRKHERQLGIEPWQEAIVEAHPGPFLRGLFHSDGCRSANWATRMVAGRKKRYDYPRWQFVNHSEEIRAWCCQALDRVGVPWRQSSWKTISVSTRAGVAVLDELIGPQS